MEREFENVAIKGEGVKSYSMRIVAALRHSRELCLLQAAISLNT
jgi:hypothetical protein